MTLIALIATMVGLGTTDARAADPVTPAALVTGRTYYVDCSRKAQGTGTHARPWHSFGPVNRHHFGPGDRLELRRGTTCDGRLRPLGSGVQGHPIVLGAYGKGHKPTVAGRGTPNLTGAIELSDQHDWTIQDLHVTNVTRSSAPRSYRSGVLLLNTGVGRLRRLVVQRLTVDHVSSDPVSSKKVGARGYGGISVLTRSGTGSGFDSLVIEHNLVEHVGRSGIVESNHERAASWDRTPVIANNVVRWARGDSIIMSGVWHGRIDHDTSTHGAALWPCAQCRGLSPETADSGIYTSRSRGVGIDHNEVSGVHKLGGDGEAVDADISATSLTVQDNYLHDNQGGGVLICGPQNVTVRYNILQNNGVAAIHFTCPQRAKSIRIYDNDVYASATTPAAAVVRTDYPSASKVSFTNNLVFSYGPGAYSWPKHSSVTANTFVGHHSVTEPRGHGNTRADPHLKHPGHGRTGVKSLGGYHLSSTKHARHGVRTQASAKVDFFGRPVNPKHPFRGASATVR